MARALALLLLSLTGCGLIPTRATDCSAARPCAEGQICDPATSTCVDSREPEAMLPTCRGACVPCQAHGDCASAVCDVYQATERGGTCIPAASVVYVDNRGGTCKPGQGDGDTPPTALCTMAEGLARIDGARKTALRVMASGKPYGPLVIDGRSVTIYGPAERNTKIEVEPLFGGDRDSTGVVIRGGARVTLDGVDIKGARVGVSCSGPDSSLTLRRSRVQRNGDLGILADRCALVVDRALLQRNEGGALAVGGDLAYSITNSFIVNNRASASPSIKLGSGGGKAVFRFNTVAENTSYIGGSGIDCGGYAVGISRSLVLRNGFGPQLQGGCRPWSSVIGTEGGGPWGPKEVVIFTRVEEVEHALDPRSSGIDRVPCGVPTDYFGTRRPLGATCDQGAHEAR